MAAFARYGVSMLVLVCVVGVRDAKAAGPAFGGSDIMVAPTTDAAGMSPAWTGRFDVVTGSLQPFSASIAIPDAYVFNGFQALGPTETVIGSMGFDLTMDSVPDFAIPIRASEPPVYASVDLDLNGRYTDGIDPCLVMTQGAGMRFFDLVLPAGGDLSPLTNLFANAFEAVLTLYPGVLVNPRTPGTYMIEGVFTSVDPDTGGEDDGGGTFPSTVNHMEEHTVTPSAASTIDPFICYKGRPSRGNICSADALANVGEQCDDEPACGGTIDVTAFCGKNRGPVGLQTVLEDPIETKAFDVKKTGTLCSPGHRSGQTAIDASTYLRGYVVKETKKSCVVGAAANEYAPCESEAECGGSACERTPRHEKQALIGVQNELGIIAVATKKVVEYLVPSVSGFGPVAPPGPTALDRYKCYAVKFAKRRCAGNLGLACKRDVECGLDGPCLRKFPKALSVSVDDTYTLGEKAFVLKKPTKLCLATSADGTPAQSPGTHLLCYAAKPLRSACTAATGVPGTNCRRDVDCTDFSIPDVCQEQLRTPKHKGLYVANALGVERLDRNKEIEICFPSMLL